MILNGYPFSIFDPKYLRQVDINKYNEQRNELQRRNLGDIAKATSDLVRALKKVEPAYEEEALKAFITTFIYEMNRNI